MDKRESRILSQLEEIGRVHREYSLKAGNTTIDIDGAIEVKGQKFAIKIARTNRRLSLYDIAILNEARKNDKELAGGIIVVNDARADETRLARMFGHEVFIA